MIGCKIVLVHSFIIGTSITIRIVVSTSSITSNIGIGIGIGSGIDIGIDIGIKTALDLVSISLSEC